MEDLHIPEAIKSLITGKEFTMDDIGMSGNQVLIFQDMVLKIEDDLAEAEGQVQMMWWLQGKVPVPRILAYQVWEGKSYLLMKKMKGQMSCDSEYLEHPKVLLEALAEGLNMLWAVDITDCPHRCDLDRMLERARMQVEHNLVDLDNVEPGTFGEGGFADPAELLKWLENNRPTEEPVLSHGDYCLPNIFLKNGKIKGFIDLGRTGIADKWCDIALCYRSLKHNFDGTYGGKVYQDFNPDMLFEALRIEPDWGKLRYYTLLDELF